MALKKEQATLSVFLAFFFLYQVCQKQTSWIILH